MKRTKNNKGETRIIKMRGIDGQFTQWLRKAGRNFRSTGGYGAVEMHRSYDEASMNMNRHWPHASWRGWFHDRHG